MNILVLSNSDDLIASIRPEAEIYVSLAKHGYTIIMMTQSSSAYNSRFVEHNIKVIDTSFKKKFDFKLIKKIRSIIKEESIDILYATNSRAISNATFACIGTNTKLVSYRGTTGGLYRHDPSSYLNALNPRVDSIICVSQAVNNHVSKQLFSKSTKVVTIYKGHDLAWYNFKPVDLNKFSISKDAFNVVCVANDRPIKGLIYLIKAAKLLSHIKNINIILIGANIKQKSYLDEIDQSGMKERIHILGYRNDVPQIIKACNVLVQPSLREGLPKVILEALSVSTPVIASAIEGNMEIINDEFNGLIVPVKDSKAISDKIIELYNSPEKLQILSNNCIYTIKNKMSHTTTVENYIKYFKLLLK
ncbi:glycosyltransferase family 4 protein [Sulfurimonas sp.]|nr:glycosyltransferase family 4 protein [Sulfurimonas sp.]